MKQVKWRNRWRCEFAETSGYIDNVHREFAEAQALAERSNRVRYGYQYWAEPIAVDAPEPKPPETLWQVHWRYAEGDRIDKTNLARSFEEAKGLADTWNAYDLERCINWLQPDGTEPALKPGAEPVRWRVHYRNRLMPQCAGSDIGSHRTMAAAQADIPVGAFVDLDFWVQPELAPAEEKPKPEPTYSVNGCPVTIQKNSMLFWLPTTPSEPCHAVWKVWCQRRSGGAVSQVSTPYGVTLDREAAEKLAKRYDDGTPLWRYWAQPACEEAKAPPIEPLYQVWGRCPDGTRFSVNEPSPYRTASDLAARLYLQTKLEFMYGIADA